MEAIDRITARHLNCGDTWTESMGDGAGEAVEYVLTHRRGIPRDVLHADAEDILTLIRWMHDEADRLEYAAMTFAREVGVPWIRIAARLGWGAAQSAESRYLRLRGEHAGEGRDARAGREARWAELRRAQEAGQREGWALSHARMIEDAAREVLASPLPAGEAENAEEVEVALGAHPASPQEVWKALRILLPGLPAGALTPVARGLADGLLADWDTRFPPARE